MPPISLGDHDRVNVVAGEQVTEFDVGDTTVMFARRASRGVSVIDGLSSILAAPGVDVTYRQHLRIGVCEQMSQVTLPHAPDPDETQGDPVAGRGCSPQTQCRA